MTDRKTKLLTTIGPATSSYDQLKALHLAGANAFRLNFSHGSHDDHLKVIQYTKQINEDLGSNICLVADLQGPKLRIGGLKESIELRDGEEIVFTTNVKYEGDDKVPILYNTLTHDINPGEKILIDDGKLELEVLKILNEEDVLTKIIHGGKLQSKKGFNLPHTDLSVPSLTPKDIHDLAFIVSQEIEWIALSFVREPKDIEYLREIILTHDDKKHVKIIAKIEKPEALDNLDGIIQAADGIMVARGDLGVEIPFENVPLIQKNITRKCIKNAKLVIIATQMMESMLTNARPSRAEVTDVANAVLDGADCLMLSGETSVGNYPIKVVETMDRIIRRTEKEHTIYYKKLVPDDDSPTFLSDAVCYNACKMAEGVDAKAINGMTYSGYTAFTLASYRPQAAIYVFTNNKAILNTMNLLWGVQIFYYNEWQSTDKTIEDIIDFLRRKSKVKSGDYCNQYCEYSFKISRKN